MTPSVPSGKPERETLHAKTDLRLADCIRIHLSTVLTSSMFRGSRRSQDFLKHVVMHALEGTEESLKERVIAVELFGRDPSQNLSEDSIVRVTAHEVRRRLKQFYDHEGIESPVRISLPAGTYTSQFE